MTGGPIKMHKQENKDLRIFAHEIRKAILYGLQTSHMGHIGGEMSLCELLSVLYGNTMRYDPQKPDWEGRDRLVLSKGHCGPALIAALALKGFFPLEDLKMLNQNGTAYPNHCDRNKTPGIDMTTGSLGQGFSLAMGMAYALKLKGNPAYVYTILGDGECEEGQVYEAALFAHTRKLNNVIAFIDKNLKQLDGYTREICDVGDLAAKFKAFEWFVQEIDGHDVTNIDEAIRKAKDQDRPSMIVLDTVKGKDCTFAENVYYNHHVTFNDDQIAEATAYLDQKIKEIEHE